MKRCGTYLIVHAHVHSFEGGNGHPPAKTFYAQFLGTDRHRFDLMVSREHWPEFFEVAVKNFTVGCTIACDFLYYPTGANALELRLASWHRIVGSPLVEPAMMRPISEAEFFDNKKITAFVSVGGRNVVFPEPIPLDGQVAIRYYDVELGEYNFPLTARGGRAPGRFIWAPYPQEPSRTGKPPVKPSLFRRLFGR